ncbi:hypothetical protein H8B09_24160 [Paenibacillus sp. PR3]|uniref:DUF1648 domain-containing protein n=1 Tax=Paenibacillus terricola TaxID=2763503 RepID=A0ABR8N3A0_9BACL|nr:hypothetical protein [Paenibacillus terricola]MBD3921877.1 hypothetical protein [Paenibacillus terricola]
MSKGASFAVFAVTIVLSLVVAVAMPLLVFFGGFPLVFHTYYDASSDHGFGHAIVSFAMVVINAVAFPIISFFLVRGLAKRQNKSRFILSIAIMLIVSIVIQVALSMLIELPVLDDSTS